MGETALIYHWNQNLGLCLFSTMGRGRHSGNTLSLSVVVHRYNNVLHIANVFLRKYSSLLWSSSANVDRSSDDVNTAPSHDCTPTKHRINMVCLLSALHTHTHTHVH